MMLTAIGLILGFGMGMSLGLLGAGGSILTVPILVYFFGLQPLTATGYSLLIVGLVALTGALNYWAKQLVNMHSALIFAVPAACAVFFTRSYLIPHLPNPVFHIGSIVVGKNEAIMLFFGLLMCLSAVLMFRKRAENRASELPSKTNWKEILVLGMCSAAIGLLTGTVGAGGGFLIVPVLIEVFKLPVKVAVGTSLTIIAANSLAGFDGDMVAGVTLDYKLLASFLVTTLLGMLFGTSLNKMMDASRISRIFAIFVLAIGITVISEEILVINGLPVSSTLLHQHIQNS